ncbi:MAG: NPCBM/NEW2 domain-containing protein [Candidatus Eremiobacteraeota bacterium]|nr:NPCBM/NEW2 domain-containing protein [Candidatus Eremiobacteraeota bacterium]
MRHLFSVGLLSLALAYSALSAAEKFPLVAHEREAVEGMVWDYGTVNMGTQSFNGRLEGLGAPGVAAIGYNFKGGWEVLEAHVGYTKNVSKNRVCKFSVLADQQTLYTSGEIHGGQEPEFIRVPIEGKKIVLLRIEPVSYGGTLNACFGEPMLKRGLTNEEKATPYQVEINGARVPYDQVNAPTSLPVNMPIKSGESTVQVKIINDTQLRKVKITTTSP